MTKVFCKDCKHIERYMKHLQFLKPAERIGETCMLNPCVRLHPIHGERHEHVLCVERNANFDCGLFEERVK